ncbi:MAG: winged helix-turn-helix domain-containing protein [Thermoplasmata archaeon]
MAESKILVKGSPFSRPKIKGDLKRNYDMTKEEVSLLLFIKSLGGKVPIARIKNESGLSDPEGILKNLEDYGFAVMDKERLGEKIILTDEGEYVAHLIYMRGVKEKEMEMKKQKKAAKVKKEPVQQNQN